MSRLKKTAALGELTLPKILDMAQQAGAVRISRPSDNTVFLQFTPTTLRTLIQNVLALPPAQRAELSGVDATSADTD